MRDEGKNEAAPFGANPEDGGLKFKELQADFILTELDLALTFCAIVRTSRNSEAMEHRLKAAEKARESAVHFKGKTIFAEDVNLAITEKLEQLQTDLANLRASNRASS